MTETSPCETGHFVRFVLTTGHALELDSSTIDEVTETWASKCCHAVCGCRADGTKVAFDVEKIAYMEEVPC